MKVVFLGQAGLLFEIDGYKIIIDPYLSNSVAEINPANNRRQKINQDYLGIKPNVLIFTHNHLDHYDEQTVKHYLTADSKVTVLCPKSVWERVRSFGGENNYVMFNAMTSWTENGITYKAVYAEHSDLFAIGVVISVKGKNYYITGDTLYNEKIFSSLPKNIYALFAPINGKGNNMNKLDAVKFAKKVKAKKFIPLHFGMMDDINPSDVPLKNKIIPEIYKEIKL